MSEGGHAGSEPLQHAVTLPLHLPGTVSEGLIRFNLHLSTLLVSFLQHLCPIMADYSAAILGEDGPRNVRNPRGLPGTCTVPVHHTQGT